MTVKVLIEILSKLPEDTQVRVYEKGSVYDFLIRGVKKQTEEDKKAKVVILTGNY